MKTIERRMAEMGKHASGFDYIRLLFAILIIARHTLLVLEGRAAESETWTGPFRPCYHLLVPVFFALSGFLVAGSLARTNNLPSFLTLRVLRIFPAMGLEILLSALILGPLLTELTLGDYFTHPTFFSYFYNIIGYIHYELPGVFRHNTTTLVNVQLWTVPFDLECYAIITVLAMLGAVRRPLWFATATVAFTLLACMHDYLQGALVLDSRSPGHMLTATFLWGVFLYLWREKVPYNGWLCLLAGAIMWPALRYAETVYIAALPIAYITVYFGLMNPRRTFVISTGDYSYGLFLYGFPIQQALYELLPDYRVWYIHLPLSLLLTTLFAYVSWHFLEARIMKIKKPVTGWVNRWSARMQQKTGNPVPVC